MVKHIAAANNVELIRLMIKLTTDFNGFIIESA